MKLGNRIMQAIEVIATLFFHKIIYSVVLLLSTMLVGLNYPYAPRHIEADGGYGLDPSVLAGAITPRTRSRSEERRVGKECRSRWSPYH